VSSSAAPTASTSTASAAPLDGAEDDVAAEDAAAAADDEAGRQGAAEAIEDAVEASEAKEAAKATKTRRLAARATDNFAREVVHRWARSAIRSLAPSATGAAAPDADDLASVCQRERGLADVLLLFATVMRTSYPTFVTALAYWNQQRMATPASLGDLFEQNVLQQKFAALILTLLEDREDRGASPLSIDGANRQRLRALLADRFGVAIRDIERLDDATVAAAMTEGGTQGVREHIDLAMLDARTHVAGNPFTPLLPRFHNHQLVYAAIASTAVASLLTSAKEAFQERTRRYIRRRLAREIAQLNLDKRNAARYGRHRSKIQDLIYQLLMRTTINVIYIGPYALPPGEARRLHAMNVGAAVEGVVAIVLGHLVGQRDSLVSGAALTAGGNMVDALTGSKGLPRDLMVFADSLIREEEGWDAERATRMGLRRAVSVGVALVRLRLVLLAVSRRSRRRWKSPSGVSSSAYLANSFSPSSTPARTSSTAGSNGSDPTDLSSGSPSALTAAVSLLRRSTSKLARRQQARQRPRSALLASLSTTFGERDGTPSGEPSSTASKSIASPTSAIAASPSPSSQSSSGWRPCPPTSSRTAASRPMAGELHSTAWTCTRRIWPSHRERRPSRWYANAWRGRTSSSRTTIKTCVMTECSLDGG
jgi:hypothetical protein